MAVYSLRLLGGASLQDGDGPVTGRAAYRRRIALLAILTVARGRPVGRDRIIGLLWAESTTDAARHTLSEALYVLRKDLSDELFVLAGDEVALNLAMMGSDVTAFEEAVEGGRPEDAVRAYGGPLLDAFYVSDAPEFERWVDVERERLARVYAQTLEALAVASEAGSDWAGAAEWWRRLATHDRYSSRIALRLVRALEAAGDRMAALRFAGTHAVLLREELGGEPDRELVELVARLRAEPLRIPAPPPWDAGPGERAIEPDGAPRAAAPAPPLPAEALAPPTPVEPGTGFVSVDQVTHLESTDASAPAPPAEHGVPKPVIVETRHAESASRAEDSREGHTRSAPTDEVEPNDAVTAACTATPVAAVIRNPEGPGTERRAGSPAEPRRARRRTMLMGWTVAGGAVGLALALFPVAGPPVTRVPQYEPGRIAVLYLDDYSAGGELTYLANGLTEMLIHQLSQVPALDVVPRSGVQPWRGGAAPLDSVAAGLGVGTVVEGSVQGAGDSVRVTVRVIDTNGHASPQSRSLSYPLGPANLFALQDAVAGEVAGLLRRRVGREIRLSDLRRRARSPRALELVLQAEQARNDAAQLAHGPDARDVRSALRALGAADSLLAVAAREDRDWPESDVQRGWVGVERSRLTRGAAQREALREARLRAEAALRREPERAEVLELRGTVLWRMVVATPEAARGTPWLSQAERDLRAAVAADPGRASAWATLSQLLRLNGDLAEAELAARRAHERDVYLQVPEMGAERLYRVALALGDYPRARFWCHSGWLQFPGDFRFRDCALVLLARDPSAQPRPDSAWHLLAHGNRLDPPSAAIAAGRPYPAVFRQMMVAAVLARAGLGDSARAVAARARRHVRDDPQLRTDFLWDEAYLYSLLGERPRSAALLDQYVEARPAYREYVLREPAFRGLWPR